MTEQDEGEKELTWRDLEGQISKIPEGAKDNQVTYYHTGMDLFCNITKLEEKLEGTDEMHPYFRVEKFGVTQ